MLIMLVYNTRLGERADLFAYEAIERVIDLRSIHLLYGLYRS